MAKLHRFVKKRKRKTSTAVLLDYTDGDGQRQRTVFGRASDAESLELVLKGAELEAKRIEFELASDKHQPKVGERSLDDALLEFDKMLDASKRAPGTRDLYRFSLGTFRKFALARGATKLKDLTPAFIVDFVVHHKGKKPNTLVNYLAKIRHFLKRCVENGDLERNPCDSRDVRSVWPTPTKRESVPTREELDGLFAALEKSKSPHRVDYLDYFHFLVETGFRLSEALALRWRDVDFEECTVAVERRADYTPKTKQSERVIPMTDALEDLLRNRLQRGGRIGEKVFHEKWTRMSVASAWAMARKRAGLDELDAKGERPTIHGLRHYCASQLALSGWTPLTVSKYLGHADLKMTVRYFHSGLDDMRREMQKVSRTKNVPSLSGLNRTQSGSIRSSSKA